LGKINKKFLNLLGIIFILLATIYYFLNKDVVTTYTGKLAFPTRDSSSILMDDGRVFVIYGNKAQIFEPKRNKFTAVNPKYEVSLLNPGQIFIKDADGNNIGTAQIKNINPQSYDYIMITKIIREENLHYNTDFRHSALLPNGKILVANGGYKNEKNGKRISKKPGFWAELCDPLKKKCNVIDKIDRNISFYKNISLKDGNVLVIGGRKANQIYDYKLNKFTPISNDWIPGCIEKVILLKNNNVLISGYDGNTKSIAESYDIIAKKFSEIKGDLPYHFSPILLKDGKVLFLRNTCDPSYPNNSKIFDPENNAFKSVSKMEYSSKYIFFYGPRCGFSTTVLPSGNVLIAGGQIGTGGYSMNVNDVDIYIPEKDIFIRKKLRTDRYSHEAVLLKDGRVLIIGGEIEDNSYDEALTTAEIFEEK